MSVSGACAAVYRIIRCYVSFDGAFIVLELGAIDHSSRRLLKLDPKIYYRSAALWFKSTVYISVAVRCF